MVDIACMVLQEVLDGLIISSDVRFGSPLFAAADSVHPADIGLHRKPRVAKMLTSFSGAALNTLKYLRPPGETSNMLAIFPHLSVSDAPDATRTYSSNWEHSRLY